MVIIASNNNNLSIYQSIVPLKMSSHDKTHIHMYIHSGMYETVIIITIIKKVIHKMHDNRTYSYFATN